MIIIIMFKMMAIDNDDDDDDNNDDDDDDDGDDTLPGSRQLVLLRHRSNKSNYQYRKNQNGYIYKFVLY